MKYLILAIALFLAGCATTAPSVTFTAKRAATLAHAGAAQYCDGINAAHVLGQLDGKSWNDARALCLKIDATLDAADLALSIGDSVTAAANVTAAASLLPQE